MNTRLGYSYADAWEQQASTVPPNVYAAIKAAQNAHADLMSVIVDKMHYYIDSKKFGNDEAGLNAMASAISADMILEGHGVSVDTAKKVIFSDQYFSLLWKKAAAIFTPPAWLKWALIGGALLGVAIIFRPYTALIKRR